jgi:hypothetical protein
MGSADRSMVRMEPLPQLLDGVVPGRPVAPRWLAPTASLTGWWVDAVRHGVR